MKIDIRSKQTLVSTSASKKQQENAKILFGSKGISILSKLKPLSKEKLLTTSGLDQLLLALKTKDTTGLEKFAKSSAGKSVVVKANKIASAKTLTATLAALKGLKPTKTLANLISEPAQKYTKSPTSDLILYTKSVSSVAANELENIETNVLLDGKHELTIGTAIFDEDDDEEYKVFILNGKNISLEKAKSVVAKSKRLHFFVANEGDKTKWTIVEPKRSDFLLLNNSKGFSPYLDNIWKFKTFFKTYSDADVYSD